MLLASPRRIVRSDASDTSRARVAARMWRALTVALRRLIQVAEDERNGSNSQSTSHNLKWSKVTKRSVPLASLCLYPASFVLLQSIQRSGMRRGY
eukprot:3075373-Pyramimonas_sp.AAC.1